MSIKPQKTKLLSVKDYASHRGVSIESVYQALRAGRISSTTEPGKRTKKIDPALADKEWDENSDPSSTIGGNALKSKVSKHCPVEEDPEEYIDDIDGVPKLAVSKRRKEYYNAEIARLRFEEQDGRLIDADQAKKEYFRVGRIIRESMFNIPDRIAPELASETDPHKVSVVLTTAIREALSELPSA